MIIRLFVALLALNFVAFVVRAEAAERVFSETNQIVTAEDLLELEERMAGDYNGDRNQAFSAIGSRLLTLTLSRSPDQGKRYASEPAQPDHGIALVNQGACLNLKWKF